ncbi:hypothetical protein K461DRAFT_316377 [Myriangium duriaei CBS 260.36]|uniref:BZIP domain-containing protein n=1 Tax=Myriangium duriaei CBS 260.36 TaxID=1168546 RepID=A0A9P4IVP3_9PEZI|nr:hypothetical protein K461DRAFT_316377 [Myriangium duriaei CBS 260.36]
MYSAMSPMSSTRATKRAARQMQLKTDLMKPGEDWRDVADSAERRKIQNRIAQRSYRRTMRAQRVELDELKQRLKAAQEGQSNDSHCHSDAPAEKRAANPHRARKSRSTASQEWWTIQSVAQSQETSSNDLSHLSTLPVSSPPSLCLSKRACILPSTASDRQSNQLDDDNIQVDQGPGSFETSPAPAEIIIDQAGILETPPLTCRSSVEHINETQDAHIPSALIGTDTSTDRQTNGFNAFWDVSWNPNEFTAEPCVNPTMQAFGTFLHLPTLPHVTETGQVAETRQLVLHLAITSGHCDILRMLLAVDEVDMNERNRAGSNPLQFAIISGKTDMVAILLEHGADIV